MKKLTEQNFWENIYVPDSKPQRGSGIKSSLKKVIPPGLFSVLKKIRADIVKDYSVELLWNSILPAYLPSKRGAKVLEVGSAPGHYLVQLHDRYGYEVYGVEYTNEGARENREYFAAHGIPKKNVLHTDFFSKEFLEANKGDFDIVYSLGFIEHFDDPVQVVVQHTDLLKKGGILFITIPNFNGIHYWLTKFFRKDLIELHNLTIMKKESFKNIFQLSNLEMLYCGQFGVIAHNHYAFGHTNSFKKPLGKILLGVQRGLHGIIRRLPFAKALESDLFSPYFVYIGRRVGE